jgi:hypothetical protein
MKSNKLSYNQNTIETIQIDLYQKRWRIEDAFNPPSARQDVIQSNQKKQY